MKLQALQEWSESHIRYDLYTHQSPTDKQSSAVEAAELSWRNELLNSPHGRLLIYNSFFRLLRDSRKLSLLHVTAGLDQITKERTLYPSGGNLVGSIYCTPLFPSNGGFLAHNLGSYVFKHEAPEGLRSKGLDPKQVRTLIIELRYPKQAFRGLIGIDYLRLGSVHLQIFESLRYLLSNYELGTLESSIVLAVKSASEFLNLCARIFYHQHNITGGEFISLLVRAIDQLPILGYLYFETISEYLMLFSEDAYSNACDVKDELNGWGYKELLFRVQPGLRSNFNLANFKPGIPELKRALDAIGPTIANIQIPSLADHVKRRLSFLVCARLFGQDVEQVKPTRWEFRELSESVGPLLGHLVHRQLRNFGRSPHFYFYFDQLKALQAWNYWNHMGLLAVFNGVIPKGEMGPNPAAPKLKYSVYKTKTHFIKDDLFVEPIEELDVSIYPRLVDLRYTFMRDATTKKKKKLV